MVEDYTRIFTDRCQIAINHFIFGCYNHGYIRKSQLHPIYVSLGNIPIWRRNKLDAKQLLGYLPILEAADKDLVREVFHKSLRHLLEPIILLKDGVDLMINNENIWFYPRVSTIIADW